MRQCECYIEYRQLVDYTPLMKPLYKTVALCFGTKERDQCSCGGDRTKCDFYPEVREKAKKDLMFYGTFVDSDGIEDSLILGIDISKKDGSTIVVGRDVCGSCEIINRLYGEEAEVIYNKLIGK